MAALQCRPPANLSRIQTTRTGSLRASIPRVAGFATWSGSAGHAGATASIKLTFDLDHSMWAAQINALENLMLT